MAEVGYLTCVRAPGTSTAMTFEPMTNTSGNIFQITDTLRRVLDHAVTPTFEDTGESPQDIPASDILSIDYLFGIVTFATSKTGPVVVRTGNYMPMSDIAGANSYQLNQVGDVLDDTSFDVTRVNGGNRTRILGIRDVNVSVARWDQGTQEFFDALNNRTILMIEVRPGGAGETARGWFVTESENHAGDVSGLESADLSFQLDEVIAANGTDKISFSWGTA